MGDDIRVSALGPVEVLVDGDVMPMRRLLERGLLVRLALARGVGVSDERLADDLWKRGGAGVQGDDRQRDVGLEQPGECVSVGVSAGDPRGGRSPSGPAPLRCCSNDLARTRAAYRPTGHGRVTSSVTFERRLPIRRGHPVVAPAGGHRGSGSPHLRKLRSRSSPR